MSRSKLSLYDFIKYIRAKLPYVFFIVFLILMAHSLASAPEVVLKAKLSLESILIIPLVLSSVCLNTIINRIIFLGAGAPISFKHALRVTIASSAAGIVPFAGPSVAKYSFLRCENVSRRKSALAILWGIAIFFITIIFITLTGLCLEFGLQAYIYYFLAPLLFLTLIVSLNRFSGFKFPIFYALLANFMLGFIEVLRIAVFFDIFTTEASIGQVMLLQASNLSSLAGGISPGGLGIKEAAAAIIASSIDLPYEAVILAYASNRLVGYGFILSFFLAIYVNEKRCSHR